MRADHSDIVIYDMATRHVQAIWRRGVKDSKVKDLIHTRKATLAPGYGVIEVECDSQRVGDLVYKRGGAKYLVPDA